MNCQPFIECAYGYIPNGQTCEEAAWHSHPFLFFVLPIIILSLCVIMAAYTYSYLRTKIDKRNHELNLKQEVKHGRQGNKIR